MDYRNYHFSFKELIVNVIIALAVILMLARLFYGTFAAAVLLIPLVVIFLRFRKIQLNDKRKLALRDQFKDALLSIADLLKTGYSVENAVRECGREMALVHGSKSFIFKELSEMTKKIALNVPVERVFMDFAARTDVDEIVLFSQVFAVAKRMGGNLTDVIGMVSDQIAGRVSVEREIDSSVSEKKFEQKIMCFVPVGMIIYLSFSSAGFYDVMYEGFTGRIIMTVCLIVYVFAIWLAQKILRKKI